MRACYRSSRVTRSSIGNNFILTFSRCRYLLCPPKVFCLNSLNVIRRRHKMKKWIALSATIVLALGITLTFQKAKGSTAAAGKPDLIVDQKRLLQNWVVRDEKLPASFCSVQEGGVTPGEHTLLRFTVSTPNIGTADVNLGDPNAHVAAGDGLYEYATCHRHFHFRHYTLYELIDPATGCVWRAAKRGFCMIDVEK